MKKKLIALGLALALVGVSVVSGTLAYLTDTDQATNVFTVGNIKIDLSEVTSVVSKDGVELTNKYVVSENGTVFSGIMPTNYIKKEASVKNIGDNPAYVRVAVIMNNLNLIDYAVGEFYEKDGVYSYTVGTDTLNDDEYIEYMLDRVFDGWGMTYSHENADISYDPRMVIDSRNYPAGVTRVDTTRLIDSTENYYEFGLNNWFGNELTQPYAGGRAYQSTGCADGYYSKILNDYEICFVYYMYLEPSASVELFKGLDVPAEFNNDQIKMFDDLKIEIYADAIQAEGFDTTDMGKEAFKALEDAHPIATMRGTAISDNESFENEITSNQEHIIVSLEEDVTYDVAAWSTFAMGGADTKDITINANGHTITFNQTNSDWNNIVTNGAKLIINDAHITNSGKNDGPWNRHDLNFACDLVLNNVTSDKAIALKAGGTLTNVTVNDANTSDTYAIWIQPNGQTVTLDGCTIDMIDCTDGRGIKIDEQYISTPVKPTLIVKNTVFKTEEKPAILVKSSVGADVIINNIDISGVAADSTNAVWVDKDRAAYADLVTVTGASKIVES